MTLREEVRAKFDEFYTTNGNAQCRGALKKQLLEDLEKVHDTIGLTWPPTKNLDQWVCYNMMASRGIIIQGLDVGSSNCFSKERVSKRNKQNRSTIEGKARTKRYNDVSNAIKKEKVRAQAKAALDAMGVEEEYLSPEKADAIVDGLVAEDKNKTIFESLRNEKLSAYVFYSACDMERESTGFATSRGSGNPIIKWSDKSSYLRDGYPDPTIISHKQFYDPNILDADWVPLYSSSLKFNARLVEDTIQERFMTLRSGIRLWKGLAYPATLDEKLDGNNHQVGISFSYKIPDMLDDKTIDVFC